MTAGELIRILEGLPDDLYVGFEIERNGYSEDKIRDVLKSCKGSILLSVDGYERSDLREPDDEMFYIKLYPVEQQ